MLDKTRILFVTGDGQGGQGKASLDLVAEYDRIDAAIRGSKYREEFELLPPCYESSRSKLVRQLVRNSPHIVHFGGHGRDRKLLLLDERGLSTVLSAEQASEVFSNDPPRLVILSACRSLGVAEELSKCVEFSIGTEDELGDRASLAYSQTFYECIGDGLSLAQAHARAVQSIDPSPPMNRTPQLRSRPGSNPLACRFAPKPLDPIEPFRDCSNWVRRVEEPTQPSTASEHQLTEVLVYALQPALYLGMLRRLRSAVEKLPAPTNSEELVEARRLVMHVVRFNEITAREIVDNPLRALMEIRNALSIGWTDPDENSSTLSRWMHVQRADWLGLTHLQIGLIRKNRSETEAEGARDELVKAKKSFETAVGYLRSIPPDQHPVRLLWEGYIALNLGQVLQLLGERELALEHICEAEKLRLKTKVVFNDHNIEPMILEQLDLEIVLARLTRLELGVVETEYHQDERSWREIIAPLIEKRDRWRGIWKHVFDEAARAADVRGWSSSELKALLQRADHSNL